MRRSYLLLSLLNAGDKIIKNMEFPACKNCIYYKPNINREFTSPLSKCEKFGVKDVVTDEITYDYADSARVTKAKCGEEGKYFLKDPQLRIKKLIHSIVKPRLFIIISIFYAIVYRILS